MRVSSQVVQHPALRDAGGDPDGLGVFVDLPPHDDREERRVRPVVGVHWQGNWTGVLAEQVSGKSGLHGCGVVPSAVDAAARAVLQYRLCSGAPPGWGSQVAHRPRLPTAWGPRERP